MDVLVTGATGFIGSHTTAALIDAGHRPRLLVRSPGKVGPSLEPLGVDRSSVDIVEGDATDAVAVREAVDGCDGAIHAAAIVALTADGADRAAADNVAAARCVLGSAADAGCRAVVHVSSLSVFALRGGLEDGPVTVDSPLRLDGGGYSRSKTDIEWYARGLIDGGVPVRIVYPSGVIGPSSPTLTNIHRAALTWADRTPLMPSGINLVDVRDVAAAAVAALGDGLATDRFLLNGGYVTWPDLYDAIAAATGHAMTRIRTPGALLRGIGRTFDLLGYEPPVPFPLTLEAMTEATRSRVADGTPAAAALGLSYRELDETLVDTYRWLVEAGHLEPTLAPRLAA